MKEKSINVENSENGKLQIESSKIQNEEDKIEEDKIEEDEIEIYKIEKEEEKENNDDLDIQGSNSLNLEDKEKFIKNNNIQQLKEIHNSNIDNMLGDISSFDDKEKSIFNLAISRISMQSFNDDSILNSFNNIFNETGLQDYLNEILKKINEGFVPFFIKLEEYSPLFIYAKSDDIFINVIKTIQKKLQIEDELVNFFHENKIIEYRYYYKTIGELKIKPLSIIKAQYANLY